MPMVWLSTLKKLIHNGIDPRNIKRRFSGYEKANHSNTAQFEITDNEKDYLDNFCNKLKYDACKSCGSQICGSRDLCQCDSSTEYQQEYRLLRDEITTLENAHSKLVVTPFRQLRNSYGYVTSIFGALNLVLTTFVKLSLLAGYGLLFVLPIALGSYVYIRGKREEQMINNDYQADVIDKKVTLFLKHRAVVNARYQATLKSHGEKKPQYLQNFMPFTIKPSKEKRGILGNPFSHFTVAALATLSMIVAALKLHWPLTLGGPVGIGVAVGISVVAGIYFGYSRYKHLISKIEYENQMSLVTSCESTLKEINRSVKQNQKTLQRVPHTQQEPSNKRDHQHRHRRTSEHSSSSRRNQSPSLSQRSFITSLNPPRAERMSSRRDNPHHSNALR